MSDPSASVSCSSSYVGRLLGALAFALCALGAPMAGAQTVDVPTHVHAVVTGEPAGAAFITSQIGAALTRAIGPGLAPDGSVHLGAIMPAPQPLDRGFQTSFTVPMLVDPGAGKAPFAATTIVDVDNADVAGFTPTTLAFRDDPEKIVAAGVLSRTTVDAQHPTRVYYYHQNVGTARRFCVLLTANDSVRTHVHVVSATAGPNVDVMSVGHAVTRTFLTNQPHDEGRVITIDGGKPLLERDTLAGPGDGIVGSVDLSVLDGGPVTLTVLAVPPDTDPAAMLYAPKLADDGHARHGDFDLAGFAQWVVAYTAGGPDAAYVYGSKKRTPASLDPSAPGHDYGDYGVLQRVTFDLANPSDTPLTIYLYEKPLGGVVRSSFLVGGTLAEMGCVRVAQRYAVSSYALAARTTAALDVVTMTDGGSNYPLEIGVTTTPPLATTPAISAPDGCFPKPQPQSK